MILAPIYSITNIVIGVMLVSICIILLVIGYRKVLSRLKREYIDPQDYCELYNVSVDKVEGEIDLFFETSTKREVKIVLLDEQWNEVSTLYDQEASEGGNKVALNTKDFPNGNYFYRLLSDNQKTTKKIRIENPV